MKKIVLKTAGIFVAVFVVSQVVFTEKANSTSLTISKIGQLLIETTNHGKGCGCSSCGVPSDSSSQDCS